VTVAAQPPRLAVISPFLDKRHGTERRVVEWISQLAGAFEIHVYSQSIENLDLSKVTWHRIPKLPGPHLFNFLWWLAANRLWRGWDRRFRGLRHDIVFSPGANCLDADAISVHIVFAQYARTLRPEMSFLRNPVWIWPRLLHRKLYYRLAMSLERRAYTRPGVTLILIARRTGAILRRFYRAPDRFALVHVGLDHHLFNPARRAALRPVARREFHLSEGEFALLLIGNDWRNKGLPVLLRAVEQLGELPIRLLVVGRDDPSSFRKLLGEKLLADRVQFLPPRGDVGFFYAAADAYVGPSLEDTFAQPPAEAMACGLPVIVSAENGASEIITHRVDGLILQDPADADALAAMIRQLYEDAEFRRRLAERAAQTTLQYTWERSSSELKAIFEEILQRKARSAAQTMGEELRIREQDRRAT
jgi:glycosyltransferase involved in cell wall biosynthesis